MNEITFFQGRQDQIDKIYVSVRYLVVQDYMSNQARKRQDRLLTDAHNNTKCKGKYFFSFSDCKSKISDNSTRQFNSFIAYWDNCY